MKPASVWLEFNPAGAFRRAKRLDFGLVRRAEAAGSVEPDAVAVAVRGQGFAGPGGPIRVDPDNLYAWRPARVGRIPADGSVAILSESAESLPPVPYPDTRTPKQWDRFSDGLRIGWDGRWQAPDPAKE